MSKKRQKIKDERECECLREAERRPAKRIQETTSNQETNPPVGSCTSTPQPEHSFTPPKPKTSSLEMKLRRENQKLARELCSNGKSFLHDHHRI